MQKTEEEMHGNSLENDSKDLGKRIGLLVHFLGDDRSAQITAKSVRQLKRYADGSEPPFSVLRNLTDAADVSFDWLVHGRSSTVNDISLNIIATKEELAETEALLEKAGDDQGELAHFKQYRDLLREMIETEKRRLELKRRDSDRVGRVRQSGTLSTGSDERADSDERKTEHRSHGDFIALPFLEINASAGYGAVVPQHEDVRTVISFERAFLRNLGAMPEWCKIISARGDSMTPTIPDGALIVVDHSQQEVVNGWISVVNVGGDLLVKRVRRRLDGTVELVSDNPIYPVETIGADRIDQLTIIGRVVYFCRAP